MSQIQIDVPAKYRAWFGKHRSLPVTVALTPDTARVEGATDTYRLHTVRPGRVAVLRLLNDQALNLGEIDRHGVHRPLSVTALHDLGAIRAAMFGASYPAPLAYQMDGGDLVHPGRCFEEHPSVMIRKTHYSMKRDEARCAVCEGPFE